MRRKRKIWTYGNKKGSALDIAYYAFLLLAFGMIVLMGTKITGAFNTEIQSNDNFGSVAKAESAEISGKYANTFDNVMVYITMILGIVTLILAGLVRVHPIFIPIFIIMLIIVIFMSAIYANIYEEFATNPELSSSANDLPKIAFILGKLPFIVGIFGMLLMIVMYKLWRNDNP